MGRVVVDLLGDHGADDGDVIRHLSGPGQVVADVLGPTSVLFELGEVALHLEFLALQLGNGLTLGEGFGHRFSVQLVELGFVVEGFQVGGPARHAEKDHPFGLGLGQEIPGPALGHSGILGKQGAEGGASQAEPGSGQKGAAVDLQGSHGQVHRLKWVSARFSTARATGIQFSDFQNFGPR